MVKEIISAPDAPAAVGPYSHAVKIGKTMYLSGQIPINAQTGEIPEGIEAQTRQVFKNIDAVLKTGGYNFADVVICEVFLQSMNDFGEMNKVYAEVFDPYCKETGYPARAAVEVAKIPKGCLVEIKATAIKE
ncbi:MAG: Rid family detoxifying hydrolase [Promethearchaeota archaeon]